MHTHTYIRTLPNTVCKLCHHPRHGSNWDHILNFTFFYFPQRVVVACITLHFKLRNMSRVFPACVWVVMVVEFFERLAYYAVTFSLTTYCSRMLDFSDTVTNVVVNVLYTVGPLSACVGSVLSDGAWGRKKTLFVFSIAYSSALIVVAVSSLPMCFDAFPLGPTVASRGLLIFGVVCLGVGYGGLKVCTTPLMADAVVAATRRDVRRQAGLLSSLFRYAYWVVNLGSLVGLGAAPFIRELDSRESTERNGGTFYAGYYVAFCMAALSSCAGTAWFAVQRRRCFDGNRLDDEVDDESTALHATIAYKGPNLLFGLVMCAVRVRLQFLTGVIVDDDFFRRHRSGLLIFATYSPKCSSLASTTCKIEEGGEKSTAGSECTAEHDEVDIDTIERECAVFTQRDVEEAKSTLVVCRTLYSLPLYWLISNQFSTNIVLQASNMNVPGRLPEEVFNNVNTLTLLAVVPLLEAVVYPWLYSAERGEKPAVVSRLVFGFVCSAVAIGACGVIQICMEQRGSYDSNGDYTLNVGTTESVTALWLILPYMLQGISSVFVDTAAMEATYVLAPPHLKSSVMALYLLASSVSGWLGLVFSPWMTAPNMRVIFFTLAVLQFFVAAVVGLWMREPESTTIVRCETEELGQRLLEQSASPSNEEN